MNSINKYQTLIIGLAVLLGLLLSQNASIGNYAEFFIVPFLMIMLFGLFLNIPVKDLLKNFSNIKFFSANIGINFIWTPLFAYGLGYLFLQNELSLWIGFVMLMVTPCTDWYLIFTGTAKGNTALSASILPLNLILQIILLPLYLLLFFGKSSSVDSAILIESIILVLLVPFVLAQITRYISKQLTKTNFINHTLYPFFDKTQVVFLGLAIMAMFALQGEYLKNNLEIVFILIIPLLLFFVVNFFIGRFVSSLLKFNYRDSVSLNLTTLARNSPISLAIAITAFPNDPLVALALVIGPLIELPILALISQLLLQIRKRTIREE
jgi:ACR3 family arsenite transporter